MSYDMSVDPTEKQMTTGYEDGILIAHLQIRINLLRDALEYIAFEPIPNEVLPEDQASWLAKYAENALKQ